MPNHDGKPDVVTVIAAGWISVLLNDGTGKLGSPIETSFTKPSQFESLSIDSAVAVDLNGAGFVLLRSCEDYTGRMRNGGREKQRQTRVPIRLRSGRAFGWAALRFRDDNSF